MSQQNVETARRAFAAFASGGTETLLAFCSEDVVTCPFPEWMEEPVYHGRDGFRELLSGWTEGFDQFVPEVEELHDGGGDIVVWLGYNAGRIKATGIPIRQPVSGVLRSARGCSPRPTTS
jgi:ketosteroid isomerase-like protein